MVIIAGTARIAPAKREELLEAARRMIAASRAEPGCISYRYAFDIDDDALVHFFEVWQDDEAVRVHLDSPHSASFIQVLSGALDGPIDVRRYEVSSSGPLFG